MSATTKTSTNDSHVSFAILKLEEAKQILMETETLRRDVIPSLRQERGEWETMIREAQLESEVVKKELQALKEKNHDTEIQIREAKRETEAVSADLAVMQEERQHLEKQIHEVKEEAEAIQLAISILYDQNQEATRKSEALVVGLRVLREEKQRLDEQTQEAKNESEALRAGTKDLRAQNQDTERESEALRAELLALREEKQYLEAQIHDIQAMAALKRSQQNAEVSMDFISHDDKGVSTAVVVAFESDCSVAGGDDDEKEMERSVDTRDELSSSSAKKRRICRANCSPKKWRRMIRTHRLRSILLD